MLPNSQCRVQDDTRVTGDEDIDIVTLEDEGRSPDDDDSKERSREDDVKERSSVDSDETGVMVDILGMDDDITPIESSPEGMYSN